MSRQTAMIFFVACLFSRLMAQDAKLKFERLSLEDGLSQSSISAILQDRQGFLWFGTQEGLNKYDGCSFTIYKYQPDDSTSLADNFVSSIIEDRFGDLWVGTQGGGLSRLRRQDRDSGIFIHHQFNPSNKNSLCDNFVNTIYEDRFGVLWIGTRSGLDKLVRAWESSGSDQERAGAEQYRFEHFCHDSADAGSLSNNFITAIGEDGAGRLWVGTRNGLNLLDRENNSFKRYTHDEKNPHSLGANIITALYRDRTGMLWIGTSGGGLNQYNETDDHFRSFRHDPKTPHSISSNYIRAIGDDFNPDQSERSILWVATEDLGVDALDLGEMTFTHYQHDQRNPASLSANFVSSLHVDRSGLLWVGTYGAGLNKSDRKIKKFVHYEHIPDDPQSLSNSFIWAFQEDRNAALWVGTDEGLNKIDRKHNSITHYFHDPNNRNSLSNSRVVTLFEDPDTTTNVLWVGTPNGLDRFDTRRNSFTSFRYDPADPRSISHNYVLVMFADQAGDLWMGTVRGLNKFDRASGTFTRYPRDPADGLRNLWVKDILELDERVLCIGTRTGLLFFDRQLEKYLVYRHDRTDRESLSHHDIYSLYQDPAGNLWIGTAGGGLNMLSAAELAQVKTALLNENADSPESPAGEGKPHRPRFVHYTEKDGLCNNYIYGILPDSLGRLWMSTNRGLACFDPATAAIKNYDVNDGLQSYEFNQGAFYKNPKGEMFFGGINGFNSFVPERLQDNSYMPPVAITAFKKFDRLSHFDQNFADLQRIVMSHDENFFTFEFVALDYTDPQRNQFAYKLEGLDQDWIYCGSRRYAIYTDVGPGSYVFRVKGSNSDGVWNEQGVALKVDILPPFWRTWWFSVVSAGILIVGAFLIIQHKVNRKIRRALELEAVRTQENERVRKQVADDFHDELGQKLTNMTLMAEVLKRNLRDLSPQNAVYLEKIRETSKSLSNGVRNFIWALDPQQDSLYDLGIYLKDFGDEIFDKSGIHFRTRGISPELEVVKLPMHWRRHLALLFKEGMNNVLKHASCHNVTLEMSMQQDNLVIALADDGRGFNGNGNGGSNGNGHYHHEKNGTNGEAGRGLGSISHRAAKLQGAVEVISNIGNGTKIQFIGHLPKRVMADDHGFDY